MNPSDFGTVVLDKFLPAEVIDGESLPPKRRYIVQNGTLVIQIDQYSGENPYSVVHYLGAVDLKFTDTILNNLTFKRQIEKEAIYIREGEIVYREKELPAKPFKSIKPEKVISDSDSFCTIDIETVSINGIQTPYLICGYIYGNFIFEYADDLTEEAQNKMFHNFISKLLQKRQIKNVYAHNLSGFDGILLLKHLINYDRLSVKPIIFNGKLMGIAASYLEDDNEKTKPFNFKFKDSYLLLPMPLRKLCTSFKVPTVKSHFPFLLSDINYSGDFPAFEFFNHLSLREYEEIKNAHGDKEWNFKEEAIKYCCIDCKALFEVLESFNKLIFDEFSLNVHHSLTLPSLAMRIYKAPPKKLVRIISNS